MSIWVITRSHQGIRGEADGASSAFPHGVIVETRQQVTKSRIGRGHIRQISLFPTSDGGG